MNADLGAAADADGAMAAGGDGATTVAVAAGGATTAAMADGDGGGSVDYAAALAEVVDEVLPGWVLRCVRRFRSDLDDEANVAGDEARRATGLRMRALLGVDLDEQRSNPLAVLRSAVEFPTAVLSAAGELPVRREPFVENAFPHDVYDISPATWSDVDPKLQDVGIAWSAWKAHEFLRRRRSEAKR